MESYGGTLLRDLRDGRLDAMIAPSVFGSAELRRVRLGREPWLVLAGPDHRLAGSGPVAAPELEGERFVVTGHRDGAAYDRFVADTLAALGVTAALERGGPGPAMLAEVTAGEALALTTTPYGAAGPVALAPSIRAAASSSRCSGATRPRRRRSASSSGALRARRRTRPVLAAVA